MKVTNFEDNNKLIEGENVNYSGASIKFRGGGNILFLEDDIDLGESRIVFDGEDSLVFLRSQAKRKYKINILIHNNSTCHIGKNNTMTEQLIINIGERKHVFLGNDVMCAAGVLIRTTDWHMIYSVKDKKRLNLSKSVFIGDHVWLAQYVMLLKGTQIASGSVVGAKGLIAGKRIPSNTCWAGNPAKLISDGIFWDRRQVQKFRVEDSEKYNTFPDDEYIFNYDPKVYIPFNEIDKQLTSCETAQDKMEYLLKISNIDDHNRFAF